MRVAKGARVDASWSAGFLDKFPANFFPRDGRNSSSLLVSFQRDFFSEASDSIYTIYKVLPEDRNLQMFMNPTDGLKDTAPWSDRDTRGVIPIASTRVWFPDDELLYTYYSPANKRCKKTSYSILMRETIGSMRTRSTVAAKLIAATFIPRKWGGRVGAIVRFQFHKLKRLISAKVYHDAIATKVTPLEWAFIKDQRSLNETVRRKSTHASRERILSRVIITCMLVPRTRDKILIYLDEGYRGHRNDVP